MSKVEKPAIGIISDEDREFYDLDLQQYDTVSEAISRESGVKNRKATIISFYTTVKRANDIIIDYAAQRLLPLTLRQIHYQMVVRHKDYPNNKDSYTHMTSDLVAARMAGLVPWNAIDDPSRGLHSQGSWDSIEQAIKVSAEYYHVGRWQNQEKWPLVLVEKDAALGIISRACDDLDVPYVSLKGYRKNLMVRSHNQTQALLRTSRSRMLMAEVLSWEHRAESVPLVSRWSKLENAMSRSSKKRSAANSVTAIRTKY
jgi:hypothetical protein